MLDTMPASGLSKQLIPLWNCANPFHGEILQRVEKLAEIASGDFDIAEWRM